MEKTSVFNLIILDESGSMTNAAASTISGCNEVINVAKSLQQKHADAQRSFVSIYAFQSDGNRPSRYLCKNVAAETVRHITADDYEPYGCTPLYDAIGSTLVDLKAVADTHEDALGVVTIITDGEENASSHYNVRDVAKLISQLKEKGWTFNFIGANIDVDKVADCLNIDNKMAFSNDDAGTSKMFSKMSSSMNSWNEERIEAEKCMPTSARLEYRKQKGKNFFGK